MGDFPALTRFPVAMIVSVELKGNGGKRFKCMTFEHRVRRKNEPGANAFDEQRTSRRSEADGMRRGKGTESGAVNH